MRLFCSLLLSTVCCLPAVATGDAYFPGERSPKAQYPYPEADGGLYFHLLPPREPKVRPFRRCILLNGHGITQKVIDFVIKQKGAGARMVQLMNALRGLTPVGAFAESYYGGPFLVDRLRKQVCDEVITTVQESTQSTIWEMTERTEAFLESHGCPADLPVTWMGQKKCALIGHSSGGTISELIARRCDEKKAKSQGVCENLAHIYTASSPSGGIGLSAAMLGAKIKREPALATDFFSTLALFVQVVPEWQPDTTEPCLLGSGIDIFSDVVAGKTNPAWHHLSPLAVLDDGIPAGLRFNEPLRGDGWFRGRLSASGSHRGAVGTKQLPDTESLQRIEKQGAESKSELLQSIGKLAGTIKQAQEAPKVIDILIEKTAQRFTEAIPPLQSEAAHEYYDLGMQEFRRQAQNYPGLGQAMDRMTWENYLLSDGLVEGSVALATCRSFPQNQRRLASSCRILNLNHFTISGFAKEAVDHIVSELE